MKITMKRKDSPKEIAASFIGFVAPTVDHYVFPLSVSGFAFWGT